MTCFSMPWSMSSKLKIQILVIIIFENFCQNLKVRYFRYIICVIQSYNISGCFQCIFIARRPNLWLLRLSNQGWCHLCSITNTTEKFWEIKTYKSILLVYGKRLVIQFPYTKNTNHRPFMQFFVLIELHEKCMISIFPYMKIVWLAFLVNPGMQE